MMAASVDNWPEDSTLLSWKIEFFDSQAARQNILRLIGLNLTIHERTKLVEIDRHLGHNKVINGVMKLLPIASKNQLKF